MPDPIEEPDGDFVEVWSMLWTILSRYVARPRRRWVHSKIVEQMADQLAEGELGCIDLQHPWLTLGDRGLVFVARWLRDWQDLFEGQVRRIDVAAHGAGKEGLCAVADALPQSTIEVDARENTGGARGEWVKGVLALVRALRQRGGGYVFCGRAHAAEADALARSLQHEELGSGGGHVVVRVSLYGQVERVLEVGALHDDGGLRLKYAAPNWEHALLGPPDVAPNPRFQHYDLPVNPPGPFNLPVEPLRLWS